MAQKPTVDYGVCYVNEHQFDAKDDKEAFLVVSRLQAKHDFLYRDSDAKYNDYINAPFYEDHLYRVSSTNSEHIRIKKERKARPDCKEIVAAQEQQKIRKAIDVFYVHLAVP